MGRQNLWDSFLLENHQGQASCALKLHFEKGVDPALRRLFLRFAGWMRRTYFFPAPLNVYVLDQARVQLQNGVWAYGSFKWFPNRSPRIKIPAAIEADDLERYEIGEIHEMILSSFVHELTHYYQWVACPGQSNAASERQANYYRYRILDVFYLQEGDERSATTGEDAHM